MYYTSLTYYLRRYCIMRKCQSSKGSTNCEDQGVKCLTCDHYVDRQSGIIVDHPASVQNDNGSSDLGVRHQTFRRIKR